jgi:hypothetical protein
MDSSLVMSSASWNSHAQQPEENPRERRACECAAVTQRTRRLSGCERERPEGDISSGSKPAERRAERREGKEVEEEGEEEGEEEVPREERVCWTEVCWSWRQERRWVVA